MTKKLRMSKKNRPVQQKYAELDQELSAFYDQVTHQYTPVTNNCPTVEEFLNVTTFLATLPLFIRQGSRVTLQFDCGVCCKKASNIGAFTILTGEGPDTIIQFSAPNDEFIYVKTFSHGKVIDTQLLQDLDLPLARICGVECGRHQEHDFDCGCDKDEVFDC